MSGIAMPPVVMPENRTVMRVALSTVEDARRVVADALAAAEAAGARRNGRVAGEVVAALRDAGLLAESLEQHYSAAQVGRLVGRSPEWAAELARAGKFGRVSRDGGGWLIPASGVQWYLDENAIT